MMLPSCGCSQSSFVVGIGPKLSRSMWVQSISRRWKASSSVMAEQTSVGPIASSILACGHSTTLTNGNMYSALAISGSGLVQCTTVGRSQPHRSPSTSRSP